MLSQNRQIPKTFQTSSIHRTLLFSSNRLKRKEEATEKGGEEEFSIVPCSLLYSICQKLKFSSSNPLRSEKSSGLELLTMKLKNATKKNIIISRIERPVD